MMRILFPYLARWHSANRSRYHHLLGALAGRGHEITVLQPPPLPGAEETNFVEMPGPPIPGLRVEDLKIPSAVWTRRFPLEKAVKKGAAALAARAEVLRRCRAGATDVLLLYHIAHAPLASAAVRVVFVDVADDLPAMLFEELPHIIRPGVMPAGRALFHRMVASADVLTTPSTVLAEHLGPRATLIPNGVDLEAIRAADPARVRAQYRPPIIGFVGAFEYFVDFTVVLDAAGRLPGHTFLLVGGGRDLSRVRDEVRRRGLRNVHLPGPVPYGEALNSMAAFDAALLPFAPGPVADGSSPLKLFEYLALGRPVFSTPMTEVHRIAGPWIEEGETPDQLVSFIAAVDAGSPEIVRRTAAARAEIEERSTWPRIASALESLLDRALRR